MFYETFDQPPIKISSSLLRDMMKLRKTVFLTFFISLSANSTSFDCTNALTETDKTICANEWLGVLDDELSYFYNKLRKSLPENKSSQLLSQQRKWVHERNETCEIAYNKKSCLNDKYRKRVNTLKIMYDEPFLPGTKILNNICGEIAKLDASGRQEFGDKVDFHAADKNLTTYDINNDGIKEVAENCQGGTMHVPCVEFKRADGTPLPIETINYEWKSYWTYGLKSFKKNETWFRLHSYDDNFIKPAYISYITPKNNEYVVCEFESKAVEEFSPNNKIQDSNELCHEVMDGNSSKIKVIKLTDKPLINRSDIRDLGRYETGLERQGYVDYDNDGSPNYIGELEYSSGAGRGCDYNYFDELSKDRTSFIESDDRTRLLEMQNVDLQGRHPSCGGSSGGGYINRFFSFNEIIYFEQKTRTNRAIYKLEDNLIHQVCIGKTSYKTKIKSTGIPNQ